MTKLYDGTRTIEIEMLEDSFPDWSDEFYNIARLPYDDELGAYLVPDVDYCIDQAMDWQAGTGDYSSDFDYYDDNGLPRPERKVNFDDC